MWKLSYVFWGNCHGSTKAMTIFTIYIRWYPHNIFKSICNKDVVFDKTFVMVKAKTF